MAAGITVIQHRTERAGSTIRQVKEMKYKLEKIKIQTKVE